MCSVHPNVDFQISKTALAGVVQGWHLYSFFRRIFFNAITVINVPAVASTTAGAATKVYAARVFCYSDVLIAREA
jgi:hypothetical protein